MNCLVSETATIECAQKDPVSSIPMSDFQKYTMDSASMQTIQEDNNITNNEDSLGDILVHLREVSMSPDKFEPGQVVSVDQRTRNHTDVSSIKLSRIKSTKYMFLRVAMYVKQVRICLATSCYS